MGAKLMAALNAALKKITWKTVLGWAASLSFLIAALLPVLPESTPPEVKQWLGFVAVAIAALTHSPLPTLPPTNDETPPPVTHSSDGPTDPPEPT